MPGDGTPSRGMSERSVGEPVVRRRFSSSPARSSAARTVTSSCARARGSSLLKSKSSQASCGIERSEEHTSELQSRLHLVCRLLLEQKKLIHRLTYSRSVG